MKRFDKGYIFSHLLSDFFAVAAVLLFSFDDWLLEDTSEDLLYNPTAALVVSVIFLLVYLCFVAYRVLYYRASGTN